MKLEPRYTATVTLSGARPGQIELSSSGASLSAQLAPFIRGPKGDPGNTDSVVASEPLGGHRAVTADGWHATPSTLDHLVGITAGAGATGDATEYVSHGLMVEPSWTWQAGAPIFVGLDGVLTQTPPVSGLTRRVAWAISETEINVDLQPTIQLSS